jgi:hypothetical protein
LLSPLCEIATKWGTDKCHDHDYTPIYHLLYGHRRESVKRVFEMGIGNGQSLHAWEEYFPNATIIGADNNVALNSEGRIKTYWCDQSDEKYLKVLRDAIGICDLMVDDASHAPGHQILTANTLAGNLNTDGYYFIEDVGDARKVYEGINWEDKHWLQCRDASLIILRRASEAGSSSNGQ